MAIIDNDYKTKNNPFCGNKPWTFNFGGEEKNIYIYPETHKKECKDIGWKLLVGPDQKDVGIDFILENFQRITVQEAVQETKIDTVLDAVKNIATGWKNGREAYQKARDSGTISYVGSYLAQAFSSDVFIKAILSDKAPMQNLDLSIRVAYALQFCLMNKGIGNIYHLPYNSSQLYVTNGTEGWKPEVSGFGGTSSNSILGKLLNFVGSQIRISTEPIWQGAQQSSSTTIQIKFNLFNDTAIKAGCNFVFLQNIMPNNMFLQYGILQQAPAYYDVHIWGNRRYPLCQGNFQCNAKGIMRKIDPNTGGFISQYTSILPNHEFRIPDVYEVDLTFKSLLPDTYNDFLYYWYLDEENDMKPQSKCQLKDANAVSTYASKLVEKGTTIQTDSQLTTETTDAALEQTMGIKKQEQQSAAYKKMKENQEKADQSYSVEGID